MSNLIGNENTVQPGSIGLEINYVIVLTFIGFGHNKDKSYLILNLMFIFDKQPNLFIDKFSRLLSFFSFEFRGI